MSAPTRSPVLGYNHNIRHRGILFHVQTEDSGVENPHIYTHIFQGGVILSSRRLEYDAEAPEETVKALMQAQHRAVLRDLKRGAFDEKIDAYFGDQVDDDAPAEAEAEGESIAPGSAGAGAGAATSRGEPGIGSAQTQDIQPETAGAATAIADGTASAAGTSASAAGSNRSAPRGAVPGSEEVAAEDSGPSADIGAALDAVQEPGHTGPHRADTDETPVSGAAPEAASASGDERAAPAEAEERARRGSGPPRVPHPEDGPGQYRRRRPSRDLIESPLARAAAREGARAHDESAEAGRGASAGDRGDPDGEAGPPAEVSRSEEKENRSSVVVSRPSVIVGGPAEARGEGEGRAGREAEQGAEGRGRRRTPTDKRRREGLFGQDLISEKSLDEVILAYLSEDGSEE